MERLNVFRKKVVNADKIEEEDNNENDKMNKNKRRKKEKDNVYKQIKKMNKGVY